MVDDTTAPPEASTEVAAPHPMEAWGMDTAAGEPLIRRELPGGGTFVTTPATLKKLEADHAAFLARPPVLHQIDIDRQRREREAAAETERKNRNPRAVLRQAHALKAEAAAECDRLQAPLDRTRQLVADLDGRIREHEATALAARKAEAAELIAALGRGEPPPEFGESVARAAGFALDTELDRARAALQQLETTMAKARDRLARCQAGIQRCAVGVMIDEAADLADEIEVEAEALHRRRADLDRLCELVTMQTRRLDARVAVFPGQVSRALFGKPYDGADRLPGSNWPQARFRELCEAPPEIPSDSVSNAPEPAPESQESSP